MRILTYRLSIFGAFERFAPTPSNTIKWTQMFQENKYELLPSIINQPSFSPVLLPPGVNINVNIASGNKGIQFVSTNGDLIVRILAGRIDVEMTNFETNDLTSDMPKKFDNLLKLMRLMVKTLKDIKGTRVAYFIDAFIPEQPTKTLQSFYASENLGFKLKDTERLTNWLHSFNQRIKIDVKGVNELSNCIFLLESSNLQNSANEEKGESEQQAQITGLHLSADINTIPENTQERFDIESLDCFCKESQIVFIDLVDQVKAKLI